ncbi:MAG: hypothetical protein JWO60_2743, partial [Frankiales bacterium]|nr:hypothetical protein [Frankiales bacterium]
MTPSPWAARRRRRPASPLGTRVLQVAAATGALLLLAAGTAHAEPVRPSPGTQTFRTVDALVPVLDGPRDDHAATIDTRLYLPSGATAARPQPAVLMTNGFGLDKLATEIVSTATFLARHGYVVLTYTAQGFGASSGCVTLQSRTYDVKDARQLITKVLEPRPEVRKDGKGAVVGTVGGSYGGGIQANLAETDARVRVIVPGRTWSSLQYSLDPDNRIVPGDPTGFTQTLSEQGVFKQQWTSLFFASGNSNPVMGKGGCAQDKLASGDPATVAGLPCLGFPLAVCRTYADLTATGDTTAEDRALVADASGTTRIDRLTVPTLLVQGQRDTLFTTNDAVSTYTALRERGVPVSMIWNWGGHGGYSSRPGECEVYDGVARPAAVLDDCYLTLRTLAFLDAHLRGRPDPSPGFTWFQDWTPYGGSGAADEQYGSAPSFPAMRSTSFTLTGSDRLARAGEVVAPEGSASFVNPPGGVPQAYTETSNQTGPDSSPRVPLEPTEQPGQHLDFTSSPFPAGLVSVGVPSANLRISHTGPGDLVFFGKVYDVAPDGSAELLRRLIAPVRVPPASDGEPVAFHLLGFAHRFAPGHRVRLTLAATDATSYGKKTPDAMTVDTGPGSTFTLPGTTAGDLSGDTPPAPVVPRPQPARPRLPATGGLPGLLP